MRTLHQRPGFSLVELLITMTLVGILAMITWLRVDGLKGRAYRASVEADLKAFAVAQELYYHSHMSYGAEGDLDTYVPTEGVTVTVTHLGLDGFAATAVHAALPGVTCGYFSGTVPAGAAAPAEDPGAPVCD